jgi:hypothetical protein
MSSFASGKFALRATGQSLAREFGPKGVHVAHAIIDGVIDIPRTKEWPVNGGVEDGKINSDAVSLLVSITCQQGDRCLSFSDVSPYRLQIHTGIYILSLDHISLRNWMFDLMLRNSKKLLLLACKFK